MISKSFKFHLDLLGEVGFVEKVFPSLVYVSGLPNVHLAELIVFETGQLGQVMSFSESLVEILPLSREPILLGTQAARTGSSINVDVGPEILGSVINPLSETFDGKEIKLSSVESRPLDITASGIKSRSRIAKSLETGVSLVDLLVPLGRGQRELVLGDRKTGKTSFLLQVAMTQAKADTICVYAAIGKKMADIREIDNYLTKVGAKKNVVLVASSSQDPIGLIILTPYTAMAVAEYFRDQGRDVLLILDDLTTHAKFYREVSLIGNRSPGRESYPGDIFYLHSKLLERAGNFITPKGEASLSCLPVAESVESDISGYIQTNLMSIVDGHIFFDNDLFVKGRRPAINPFLSVTRVGRQTQPQVKKDIHREVNVVLGLYNKSQEVAHFGNFLLENVKVSLATGEKIWLFFEQETSELVPGDIQVVLFALIWLDFWPNKDLSQMREQMTKVKKTYQEKAEFKTMADGLVAKSQSFNDLLRLIQENRKNFDSVA